MSEGTRAEMTSHSPRIGPRFCKVWLPVSAIRVIERIDHDCGDGSTVCLHESWSTRSRNAHNDDSGVNIC